MSGGGGAGPSTSALAAARLLASALRRNHWRASLLLVLLIGLAGGVVLTAIAGARRTERALPEFVSYNDQPSLLVALCPPDATQETVAEDPLACFFYEPDGELDELARLPGVRAVGRGAAVLASATLPDRPDEWGRVLLFAQQARSTARSFGRPLLIEGRTLDPEAPDELEIDEETARALSLDVGDQLVVSPYLVGEMDVAGEGSVPASGPATALTVVGIVRHPKDVSSPVRNEVGFTEGDSDLYVGPGWWEANGPAVATYGSLVAVHADDPRTVEQTIRDHWPGRPVLFETDDELASDEAEQAIRLEAKALWIVAAVAMLAALVFVSQTVGRQLRRELQAVGAVRALGMTRRELTLAVALRMATVAVGAGLLAAGTAVLMSPLAPVGIARRAALDQGLAVDAPVLMAGAALVVIAVLAMALPVAARSSAEERATTRLRMVGPRARRLSAEGLAGLRLTGPGGGRSVGTAVLGVAVAAAAAVSAATLVQTLGTVSTTPASWGWGFDAGVGNASDLEQEAVNLEKVLSLPVEAAAAQLEGNFEVVSPTRRIETTLVALERVEQLPGALTPVMTGGRPPGPGEVALGAITRRQLDVDLGDVVAVRDPSLGGDAAPATELVVVGEARVVDISGSQPGHGGYVDPALIRGGLEYSAQMFALRFDRTVDRDDALAATAAAFPKTLVLATPPQAVANLGRLRWIPWAIVAIVGTLALVALGHALFTAVRVGRRDLAVYRALGFTSRQTGTAVTWFGTFLAGLAVAIGVPLGLAGGRWLWRLVDRGVGTVFPPVVPIAPLAAAVVVVLVVANVVALLPARRAARLRPAQVLRSE